LIRVYFEAHDCVAQNERFFTDSCVWLTLCIPAVIPLGFCYFNNIAVAAKHSVHTGQADRVFILDFDIHHGNGIQDVLFDCPVRTYVRAWNSDSSCQIRRPVSPFQYFCAQDIFYLSIHRGSFEEDATENDFFYPGTGHPTETGAGCGAGSNLNIVWPRGGMGNTEYAAAFTEVVLPVLSAFNPDLILIACGLDAAKGDLLGDCGLSPDMYYIMIKSLLEIAGVDIPMVAALEGGYNLEVIGKCMEAVALAMFDEPWEEKVRLDSEGRLIKCDLSRYWNQKDFEGERKLRKATKKAIAAIKQSAEALVNRGLVYPRNHRPQQQPEKVMAETATLPFKKRKCFDVEMEAVSAIVALDEK
jgi:acetoin utilization deacetylase AcuC-like enzyme